MLHGATFMALVGVTSLLGACTAVSLAPAWPRPSLPFATGAAEQNITTGDPECETPRALALEAALSPPTPRPIGSTLAEQTLGEQTLAERRRLMERRAREQLQRDLHTRDHDGRRFHGGT